MMKKLTVQDIFYNNTLLIKSLSSKEQLGVREPTALHMCINSMDITVFGKEVYPTLVEKAAILFINLIKKYCFYNGNKRTAYMSLIMFLRKNGYNLKLDLDTVIQLCVKTATWSSSFHDLKERVVKVIQGKLIA